MHRAALTGEQPENNRSNRVESRISLYTVCWQVNNLVSSYPGFLTRKTQAMNMPEWVMCTPWPEGITESRIRGGLPGYANIHPLYLLKGSSWGGRWGGEWQFCRVKWLCKKESQDRERADGEDIFRNAKHFPPPINKFTIMFFQKDIFNKAVYHLRPLKAVKGNSVIILYVNVAESVGGVGGTI